MKIEESTAEEAAAAAFLAEDLPRVRRLLALFFTILDTISSNSHLPICLLQILIRNQDREREREGGVEFEMVEFENGVIGVFKP